MPNFAIRVELKGYPTVNEYQALHTLMAKKGFSQTIPGIDTQGNRRSFDLPHAVYYGTSVENCYAVRDGVLSSIKREVQDDVLVFVVQEQGWAIGS